MGNKTNLCILGSTGSIGTQTLQVAEEIGNINVVALTANRNIELLEKQIRKFNPDVVAVYDIECAEKLRDMIKDTHTQVLEGMEGLIKCAALPDSDVVLNSVVGSIGLMPTITAIRCHKNIALANKETLVCAGELIMSEVKKNNVNMYPVDSEHSAIFQCLVGNEKNKIRRIFLTASGGPFRERYDMENITVDDALKHPNWHMGKKITIDSATLMNKGLEIIEAKWLFDVDVSQIEVVVHPESIIHSMVEYEDGVVIAQMGVPDMRLPISYALTYPFRAANSFEKLNLFEVASLTFSPPDVKRFPCLSLAIEAIKTGGTLPAVMNCANEVAVEGFLKNKISFCQIPIIIEKTMSAYNVKYNYDIDDVLYADVWAERYAKEAIELLGR